MTENSNLKHELVELPRLGDAQEVVYALRIRGIEAKAVRSASLPLKRGYSVQVCARNLEQAKAVLPLILNAMLPARADDGQGGCFFCGYSLLGTASHTSRCPECGGDLLSLESRLASRGDRKRKG